MNDRHSDNHQVVPRLEQLDSRDVPAGNVIVTLSGGGFVIAGDDAANQISVQQNAAGDVFVVGLNGTTVNGQSALFVGNGIPTSVTAWMGNGSDYIEVVGLVAGNVTLRGEAGFDTLVAVDVFANNNVELFGGGENDTMFMADVTAGNIVSLDGRDGFDSYHIQNSAGFHGTVIVNMERQF